MYLRYSSSVVAPMQCSSPRASIGLSKIARVHRAFGLAAAHHGVQFVDEQDDLALAIPALPSSTALRRSSNSPRYLRTGDQRAHVERDDPLVLQAFRHIAAHDAQRQPFDDGRLADARLADQHRIVLGAPRQHLDHAADLLVAANHRIELALRCQSSSDRGHTVRAPRTSLRDSAWSRAGCRFTSRSACIRRSRGHPEIAA